MSKLGNQSNPAWRKSASRNRRGKWTITNGQESKMLHEDDAILFLKDHLDWYRGMDDKRKEVLRRNNTSGIVVQGLKEVDGVKVSHVEMAVYRILCKYYSDVVHSYLLKDTDIDYYHVYDYYLPELNLLGEFDGDYWHRDTDYNNDLVRFKLKLIDINAL